MASILDNLLARKTAIAAELAAIDSTKPGGRPNISGGGGGIVDHVAYKKGLYEELAMLDEQISIAQGPFEIQSRAYT